jgi:DNA-binding GntR family transcriptional regulator
MEPSLFSKIEQRTIDDEILLRLRAAIVNGSLKPGERLPEAGLAKQLAVSRIPVREALRTLEQEGLVTRQPNRGCFVTSFGRKDVEEVFSLRARLECMAIERASRLMIAADFEGLFSLIARQAEAGRRKDYDSLTLLDLQFHELLCRKADHSRLWKAWSEQQAQCQMLLNMRFRSPSAYTPDLVVADHERILDAMKDGDVSTAIDLTERISRRVMEECIELLESRR